VKRTHAKWGEIIVQRKVLYKIAHVAPALVIYFSSTYLFPESDQLIVGIKTVTLAYIALVVAWFINSFLSASVDIYQFYEISRHRPIKGYIQALRLLVTIVAGIFILSILMNRSPWGLISVLGGLTAVLILVFKDAILGFVASIQLISNQMVARGDWIQMDKYGADGDIIDISLTTVKVRNWDKTITTIPTYALVSDSFKNWRGMQETGGRRIKRSLHIDMNTIKFCTDEMLERFGGFQHLIEYLKSKKDEIYEFNKKLGFDMTQKINGRRLTNVGVFRAYVELYLRNHPKIHQGLTFLIRHLQPTAQGLPIEIYVFTNDTVWANYESIQSDIFDHVLAAVPEFDLRVFQNPAGTDFQHLAKK